MSKTQRSIDGAQRPAHDARGAGQDGPRARRPRGADHRGTHLHVRPAARRSSPDGGRHDRARRPGRRPGGDLVAQHLALGGGQPGHPLRRCGGGAAEHPLHRRGSRRHPGSHPGAAADRDGPVPGRRPGGRPRPRRASRPAAHRPGTDRGRTNERDVGRLPVRPAGADVGGRRPRRRAVRRRRLRHPVHLRNHRPQQRRAVRAPAVPGGTGRVGGVRSAHQRRPLPVHQPVLPQLRLQGRHPGLPADRRHADPAADLRPRAGDADGRGAPRHRAAGPADDLPDAARPPGPGQARPELAALRGHRGGDDPRRPHRAHAGRTRLRHRAHRLRADRGNRLRHHVPRRGRRGHRGDHLRAADRRLRAAHRQRRTTRAPARCCCADPT